MGLALAGILAGLGLVFMITGGGVMWAARVTRDGAETPDTVPESFTTETTADEPAPEPAS